MKRLELLKREKMMTALLFDCLKTPPSWLKKTFMDNYDNDIATIEIHGGKNPEIKEDAE